MLTILLFVQRNWRVISCLTLMAITLLSLWPLSTLPDVPGNDKFHHFIAYAALMFPAVLAKPRYLLVLGVFFIVWSGAIELVQPYVNRYAEWLDLAANTGGIIAGFLGAVFLQRLVMKESSQ